MNEIESGNVVFKARGKGVYNVYPKGFVRTISGQTGLNRYPEEFQMSLDCLKRYRPGQLKRVGSYPGSVFAEAASLQAHIHNMELEDEFEVEGVDACAEFIAHARNGMHLPSGMLQDQPKWLRDCFNFMSGDQWVAPKDVIKDRIKILPAQDLTTYRSDGFIDAMFINNLFFHLSDEDMLTVLDNLIPQSNGLVCIGGDFSWDEWKAKAAPESVRDRFLQVGFSFASPNGDVIDPVDDGSAFFRHKNSDSFIAIHPNLLTDMRRDY